MSRSIRRGSIFFTSVTVAAIAAPAFAHDVRDLIGYIDLIDRLGSGNEPTGAGIIAGHVEAPDGQGRHQPDPNDAHFTGKTFVFMSGGMAVSNHANSVGRHLYGDTWGAAPGVNDIHVWEANHWIGTGFLHTNQPGVPPDQVAADLFNNSWVGHAGGFSNEILRRVDFAVNDQDLVIIGGVGNSSQPLDVFDTLLSHGYNVISVGRNDGQHHHGDTLFSVDGGGRMKPEIVSPETATSWATGIISGCVADLQETARTWPGLDNNTNADRAEVIKAVLLAGAMHGPTWTNNPQTTGPDRGITDTPIDATFGAGFVDINFAHMVHTGLEQNGSTTVPLSGTATNTGWDLTPINSNQTRYYRFELSEDKETFAVLLTWNRRIAPDFLSGSLPNLSLELFEVDNQGNLTSLRGNNGVGVFASGNIASVSAVDNIEHLFIRDLVAGNYILAVSRPNDGMEQWDAALGWILPPDTATPADLINFMRIFGTVLSGGLAELQSSNNMYLVMRSQPGFTAQEPNILEMELTWDTDVAGPSTLTFLFEGRLNQPGGTATLRLRNINTNGNEVVGQFAVGATEITAQIPGISATNYATGAGQIIGRFRIAVLATFSPLGFDSFTDFTGMNVN